MTEGRLTHDSPTLGPHIAAEALAVLESSDRRFEEILATATAVRRKLQGDNASLCSIMNAKSGLCSEDCIFCAQSTRYNTDIAREPLASADTIVATYDQACGLPIKNFSIVTSGKALGDREIDVICRAIDQRRDGRAHWCASLGTLNREQLDRLRQAGLSRYHHNLETAESFFANICTTHTYADRVATVRAAMEVGLQVCAGGLLGLGESPRQRVELALALSALGVDSIPLNFLVPIANTPAAETPPLDAGEILRTIAMFRLVCPHTAITIAAGRERRLGGSEELIFAAGATGMMVGGYLTVAGRAVSDDLAMLRRAGMTIER